MPQNKNHHQPQKQGRLFAVVHVHVGDTSFHPSKQALQAFGSLFSCGRGTIDRRTDLVTAAQRDMAERLLLDAITKVTLMQGRKYNKYVDFLLAWRLLHENVLQNNDYVDQNNETDASISAHLVLTGGCRFCDVGKCRQ